MRLRILFITLPLLLMNCGKEEKELKEEVYVNNFNIIIAPDLSNRINPAIHPKPVHDTIIINRIYEAIEQNFLKIGGRQTNQQDKYTLDFINRGALNSSKFKQEDFTIDFNRFGTNQLDRSNYIRNVLATDVNNIKSKVNELYEYSLTNLNGADVYGYLNNTVNNLLVDNVPKKLKINKSLDAIITTKNIVILFTDGYIENKTEDKGYTLTGETIRNIRREFNNSGEKSLKVFINNNKKFHVTALNNEKLNNVHLIVVEMVDRSLDKNGVAISHPTDFEIMKEVWDLWLNQSKLKSVDFVQAQNNPKQVISRIERFMKSSSINN